MSILGNGGSIQQLNGQLVAGQDADCCCGTAYAQRCGVDCAEQRVFSGQAGPVFEAEGECWSVINGTPPPGLQSITPGASHQDCETCGQPEGCTCAGYARSTTCNGVAKSVNCFLCHDSGAPTSERVYLEIVNNRQYLESVNDSCGCTVYWSNKTYFKSVRVIANGRNYYVSQSRFQSQTCTQNGIEEANDIPGGGSTNSNQSTQITCDAGASLIYSGQFGCSNTGSNIGSPSNVTGRSINRQDAVFSCNRAWSRSLTGFNRVRRIESECTADLREISNNETTRLAYHTCSFNGCPDEEVETGDTVPCGYIAVSCDGTSRISIDFAQLMADVAELGGADLDAIYARYNGTLYRPTTTLIADEPVDVDAVIDENCNGKPMRLLTRCPYVMPPEPAEPDNPDLPGIVLIAEEDIEAATGAAIDTGVWSEGSILVLDIDGISLCYEVGPSEDRTLGDGYEVLGLSDACDPCSIASVAMSPMMSHPSEILA